ASGTTDGAQCSWNDDSSIASNSYRGAAASASGTGRPMFPHAADAEPAASRIDCSIAVVVVLPFVPVTTSQRRGAPNTPARSQRHASSTSPHTGTPAPAAADSNGLPGDSPGLVTTRSRRATRPISSSAATT